MVRDQCQVHDSLQRKHVTQYCHFKDTVTQPASQPTNQPTLTSAPSSPPPPVGEEWDYWSHDHHSSSGVYSIMTRFCLCCSRPRISSSGGCHNTERAFHQLITWPAIATEQGGCDRRTSYNSFLATASDTIACLPCLASRVTALIMAPGVPHHPTNRRRRHRAERAYNCWRASEMA